MVHLSELFGKRSILIVLEHFLRHPKARAYAGELSKKIKIARKSLFDSLSALVKAGFLLPSNGGRTIYYSLNLDNPVARQLKVLLAVADLTPQLAGLKGTADRVYLFGSAARGEDDEESDLDLLIIAPQERSRITAKLKSLERRAKPLILTPLEYSQLARRDKPLYERIERDKIRLV